MKRIREAHPELPHREAFGQAAQTVSGTPLMPATSPTPPAPITAGRAADQASDDIAPAQPGAAAMTVDEGGGPMNISDTPPETGADDETHAVDTPAPAPVHTLGTGSGGVEDAGGALLRTPHTT